jgi:hypothetical protein
MRVASLRTDAAGADLGLDLHDILLVVFGTRVDRGSVEQR